MTLNKAKYGEAILYLCSKLGGEVRGKKKLAKLLYFVDFDLFEKTETSLTGDVYRALPMGPFPETMEEVTVTLAKEGALTVSTKEEFAGYMPTETYTCARVSNESVFSKDELDMLERVVTKYGHLNGKQLEDLTHSEAPYLGTEPLKEIVYELAFYRGTDFSE